VEEQAYIGELIAALVYLYVGTRLLRLSSRTGEVPERLLGVMFLVTGASFLLYDLPIIFNSESLWTPLNFAGRVAFLPAPMLLAVGSGRSGLDTPSHSHGPVWRRSATTAERGGDSDWGCVIPWSAIATCSGGSSERCRFW